MEQGGGDKNQQQQPHQDRKEKEVMQQGTEAEVESAPPPQPPQQPVKCPRCESVNTKFCYYNNYSLSQPRFFCKTCRRYWTHGGTLRNVPVGGSCRKAKRARDSQSSSSSAENSASSSRFNNRQQPQPQVAASQEIHQPNHQHQHLMAPVMMGSRDIFPLGLPSHLTTHFLQGGGFGLGSASASAAALGGIHHQSSSLNPPPNNNPFDLQALNVGVGGATTSNLQGVLSGLINANNNSNVADSVVGGHQRLIRPSSHQQYFQLGVGERDLVDPLFPPISEQLQALMIPSSSSTMANSSTSAGIHPDWAHHHQRFITVTDAAANNNNNIAAGGSMWSTVSSTAFSANGNNSHQRQRNVAADVMPNHHQWPNVPGFGPPPPPPPSSF